MSWYNTNSAGSYITFPIEALVGPNLETQVAWTHRILLGFGLMTLVAAVLSHIPVLFPPKEPERGPDDDLPRSM